MTTSPTAASHPTYLPSSLSSEYKMYPSFLLFGDSITQGANSTLLASLSDYYSRRVDVLNRGLSGYTAPSALPCLEQFFPSRAPSATASHVRIMTVHFGANDATLPGDPQHVSLDEYRAALRQIASHQGVVLHRTKVIFITPPPVDEWQLQTPNRNAAHTAIYAAACREVASDLGLPCLDLWSNFMRRAGWKPGHESDGELIGSRKAPKNQVLADLLVDGLHFTDQAYGIWFEELVKLIETRLPDDAPGRVPWVLPDWKDDGEGDPMGQSVIFSTQ